MDFFFLFLSMAISYCIGSIPTAYIFCRIIKGTDIRTAGSGNVGATNAMRVLGKRWGVTVLVLDVLKGAVPVVVLGNYVGMRVHVSYELVCILIGLSCIAGHNWTIFLGFKGGKGVATTLGVLIGLTSAIISLRLVLISVILTWFFVFFILRIVSLASIIAAVSFPVFLVLFRESPILIVSGIIFSVFIILRHQVNIKRLIRGEEKKLF